jgi:PsbP-like protein/zinc-ribbon domain
LTKICAKCGNENSDSANFCEICGKTLQGVSSEGKIDRTLKSRLEVISSWWKTRSTGGKAIIGVGCFVGLILIIAIIGIFSPDQNQTKHYESDQFSFDYPGDWNLSTTELNHTKLEKNESDNYMFALIKSDSLGTNEADSVENFKVYVNNSKLNSTDPTSITKEGFKTMAGKRVFTKTIESDIINYYQAMIYYNNMVYNIRFTGNDKTKTYQAFETVLNSFQIKR